MNKNRPNRWDFFSLALWSLFFAVGLAPEPVFYTLRDLASLSAHRAWVNSSATITLSFSLYLGWFVLNRCRQSGMSDFYASSKAVQIGLLGILAFLEIPAGGHALEIRTLLELTLHYKEFPTTYVRSVVLFVGLGKLAAWWYLYSLIVRFHLYANRNVFVTIHGLFPSARTAALPNKSQPEIPREQ